MLFVVGQALNDAVYCIQPDNNSFLPICHLPSLVNFVEILSCANDYTEIEDTYDDFYCMHW